MASDGHDISRIQVQITVAKWHLHTALSAVADVAVHKLECARLAYAEIVRSLGETRLTGVEHEEIRRQLTALECRLETGSGRAPAAREGEEPGAGPEGAGAGEDLSTAGSDP